MEEKKESVEVECPECGIRFRLWIPERLSQQWGAREEMGCIKCRTPLLIEKGVKGLQVLPFHPPTEREGPTTGEVAPETPEEKIWVHGGRETILIVDDEMLIRKMIEDTLTEIGLNPIGARNAQEAFEVLEREDVKAIVVDLYLKNPQDPQSNIEGEEFLRKVVERGKTIPAIVLTGRDLIDELALDPKWFDLQVKGFIQKGNPFWIDELGVKVKRVL